MSWKDIVKLKGKQKNLDKNHNGVIDAQDFYIMNGETKKAQYNPALGQPLIDLIEYQKNTLSDIDELARIIHSGETVALEKMEELAAINLRQSDKIKQALISLIEVVEGR